MFLRQTESFSPLLCADNPAAARWLAGRLLFTPILPLCAGQYPGMESGLKSFICSVGTERCDRSRPSSSASSHRNNLTCSSQCLCFCHPDSLGVSAHFKPSAVTTCGRYLLLPLPLICNNSIRQLESEAAALCSLASRRAASLLV